jgi:hypothetical protein
MCIHNSVKTVIFLAFFAFLGSFLTGCGPMDSLFTTTGKYKVNVLINDIPLDECSFIRSSDRVRPYFAESVSRDPDVTALMVFLRDPMGEIVGWRVVYKLDEKAELDDIKTENDNESKNDNTSDGDDNGLEKVNENEDNISAESENFESFSRDDFDIPFQLPSRYKNGDELIIPVKSLDKLPIFPIPSDLPMGRYTIVSHVMSDKDVLQRLEKSFFYLSNIYFSYDGINVHLPGITENSQLIPRGTVIMLEADLSFDRSLDPYIEWYNGRRKIAEGKISDGAGQLFWKAPEDSGFYSISAVVYPVENFYDLSGYQRDVSLLVSTKIIDMHFINPDIPRRQGMQLMNWYIFEGNLIDSSRSIIADQTAVERSLRHSRNAVKWRASNGTYGAATGNDNILNLPRVDILNNEYENWQTLFRFKAENDGGIFSVQFGRTNNVFMHLYIEGSNLILTLTSPVGTVSQIYNMNRVFTEENATLNTSLSASAELDGLWADIENEEQETDSDLHPLLEESAEPEPLAVIERRWEGSFLTVGVMFTVKPGLLSAQINFFEDYINREHIGNPISIEIENINEFLIMLGFLRENIRPVNESSDQSTVVRHEFTALWDEFSLYRIPRMEIYSTENQQLNEEQQTTPQVIENNSQPPAS